MLIRFEELNELSISNQNGGDGTVLAKMLVNAVGKIMICRLPAGTSIGLHTHHTGSEISYVVSGEGRAVCDGTVEYLQKNCCHYCPAGSSHSIANTGQETLVLFTVVTERA